MRSQRPQLWVVLVALVALAGRVEAWESVWPVPTNVSSTGRLLFLHPRHLKFHLDGKPSSILDEAFERYNTRILDASYPTGLDPDAAAETIRCLSGADGIRAVSVFVVSSDQSLGPQTSETYTLRVNAPTTIIHATSIYGALRAMETLSQMAGQIDLGSEDHVTDPDVADALEASIKRHGRGKWRRARRLALVNETSVWDSPRFRHRGLLLDSARHFLPVPLIKTHLDAMAMAKLNVLHWHLSDDQAFPYGSAALPELAEAGAFSPTAVYSPADVQDIVSYARSRGVRVIPEFDSPGHAASWGASHPEILVDDCPGDGFKPMDPSNNETYALLWQLLRDVAAAFPDAAVHLGGDEVDLGCWEGSNKVKMWMDEQGYGKDTRRALAAHVQRTLELAAAAGKEGMVWEEAAAAVGGADLDPSVIVQVWRWKKELSAAARVGAAAGIAKTGGSGDAVLRASSSLSSSSSQDDDEYWLSTLAAVTQTHRAVLSAPWYLNLVDSSDPGAWRRLWEVEPLSFKAGIDQKDRVVGGEAAAWGEMIDATNSESKTWPLAAAVAERLWADESVRDGEDAAVRLAEFRCKLVAAGVAAAPLGPGACTFE